MCSPHGPQDTANPRHAMDVDTRPHEEARHGRPRDLPEAPPQPKGPVGVEAELRAWPMWVGWKRVERLLATYVDQDVIVMALLKQINRAES